MSQNEPVSVVRLGIDSDEPADLLTWPNLEGWSGELRFKTNDDTPFGFSIPFWAYSQDGVISTLMSDYGQTINFMRACHQNWLNNLFAYALQRKDNPDQYIPALPHKQFIPIPNGRLWAGKLQLYVINNGSIGLTVNFDGVNSKEELAQRATDTYDSMNEYMRNRFSTRLTLFAAYLVQNYPPKD